MATEHSACRRQQGVCVATAFFAWFVWLQAVQNNDAQVVCLGAFRKQQEVPGKSLPAPFHHQQHRQQEEESYGGW